jgi:hypothetical protein
VHLSSQIHKSFRENGIHLQNYTQNNARYNSHITICINSLLKLAYSDEDISNSIVYVDEINSFLKLTHNSTLDNKMKLVFTRLVSIIKHCKKIIVSDNIIRDGVFEFLKYRSGQKLYVQNSSKRFERSQQSEQEMSKSS